MAQLDVMLIRAYIHKEASEALRKRKVEDVRQYKRDLARLRSAKPELFAEPVDLEAIEYGLEVLHFGVETVQTWYEVNKRFPKRTDLRRLNDCSNNRLSSRTDLWPIGEIPQ